jgi:Zn finger protein HypA/HybF involved in hydrogenase expression
MTLRRCKNNMCSVGDGFNIDISALETKLIKCEDCGNEFKGIGNKARCPSCHSANVTDLKN